MTIVELVRRNEGDAEKAYREAQEAEGATKAALRRAHRRGTARGLEG